jgi:hypothetical protein
MELHNLYSSSYIVKNKSRKMRLVGHVTRRGEMRSAYPIWGRKPGRKGPLLRHNRRWEDNVEGNIKEGYKGVDWFNSRNFQVL